ncbi:MAG TPA: ATP-binding cassette domain-containing protein, partial [Anaerolineales bacterium]|nr:ATP-binding cassette domain-containing protein [Anaerolineales bacterium]
MATQDHIVIEQLDKIFTTGRGERQVQALDRLSLKIPDGHFFSVLGPSGCGKSTLLRIVGGLIEPTAGTVSIGNGSGPREAQRGKEIGFVFQEPGLLPW